MSSKEEDKNKQTGTPTQRRARREDRELARQRAEAKSPEVGKLQPLGGKSRVSLVSPELSYAEKLKGGNISDPKEREEEEEEEEGEGEEEEDKKAGDEEEKEDPKDDNSSNGPNSNMAALQALPPFDLDLTHVLTIVCGFPNPSAPISAVTEYGITTTTTK